MEALFSHPGRLLQDHIKGVCRNAQRFCTDLEPSLKKLLLIIAFAHDLGKSTSYFQRYLAGEESLKNNPLTHHALLGAIAALHIAIKEGLDDPLLLALAFLLPKRHHGNLHSFDKDLLLSEEDIKRLQKQIDSIDKKLFQKTIAAIGLFDFCWEEVDLQDLQRRIRRLKLNFKKEFDTLDLYLQTLTLFSLLIDSDKMDAVFKEKSSVAPIELDESIVINYLKSKKVNDTSINRLRQEAFDEAMSFPIDPDRKIYDLSLPTGMGKTLISFAFALRLAKKAQIIYALPFLSIIEQNFSVIEEVLRSNGIPTTSDILLKHHHLSDISYKSSEDQFDYDRSRILVEGWQSKIVVTTFVQFFHTIIGYRNKTSRRFHRLSNAVVILDEVQSIPVAYWKLIRSLIEAMAQKYDFYVVFVTATQPMIVKKSCSIVSKRYFESFNRYRIVLDLEQKSVEEFLQTFSPWQGRQLIILNTISQAKLFFDRLKEYQPLYLSTHIIPKERKKRIEALRHAPFAITTQLVEAGVDVDFDYVVRDFAPFDSIVQSAGRCNREGKREQGIVQVLYLVDEQARPYSSYIYDSTLLLATREIVRQESLEEREVLSKIDQYFSLLERKKSFNKSEEFVKALKRLDFDKVKEFQLIEERPYLSDVFVQLDEEGVRIWSQFCETMQIEDLFKRKEAFDRIKAKFYDYIVSVPIKDNEPPIECGYYVVYREDLSSYYDEATGFITKRSFEIL